MRYKIVTYRNGLNKQIHVPQKKYPFWPFWLSFTFYDADFDTHFTEQFDSFEAAKEFIEKQKNLKWVRLNHDIEIKTI